MEEKLSNKTCGECKHYIAMSRCILHSQFVHDDDYCGGYAPNPQPITNGDVIRQGNNRKLAEIFDDLYNGNKCKYCIHRAGSGVCKLNPTPYSEYDEGYLADEDCLNGFEAWLNAPACVKQNGNHDTQTDLCKAVNTENEGEGDE